MACRPRGLAGIAQPALMPDLVERLHKIAAAGRVVAGAMAVAYEAIPRVAASKDILLVGAHGGCFFVLLDIEKVACVCVCLLAHPGVESWRRWREEVCLRRFLTGGNVAGGLG